MPTIAVTSRVQSTAGLIWIKKPDVPIILASQDQNPGLYEPSTGLQPNRWLMNPYYSEGKFEHVAIAQLGKSKRLQAWFVSGGKLSTVWEAQDPTFPQGTWRCSLEEVAIPFGISTGELVAGNLNDGRITLWAVSNLRELWTKWKTSTDIDSAWTDWQLFPMPPAVNQIDHFALVRLSDGRFQIWCTELGSGKLWTNWKQSSEPDAQWEDWSLFPALPDGYITAITAAAHADGRTQLFVIANIQGKVEIWTCVKQSTRFDDQWTDWAKFQQSSRNEWIAGEVPDEIVAARVAEGKCKLWMVTYGSRNLYVSEQATSEWDSPWSGWSDFLPRLVMPTYPLQILTQRLARGILGQVYRQEIRARGGSGDYEWFPNNNLPPGLEIFTDGTLEGIPTMPGAFDFSIGVRDSNTTPAEASYTYHLDVKDPRIINPPELADLMVLETWIEPNFPKANEAITINCTYSNQGNAVAESCTIRFELDVVNDSNEVRSDRLTPGQRGTASWNLDGLPKGDYHCYVYVDRSNDVNESNENNNVGYVGIIVWE